MAEYELVKVSSSEVAEILDGMNGVTPLDLERVRVPSGGTLSWVRNGPEGEQMVKELVGVVMAQREGRLYWQSGIGAGPGGGSSPPDCVSDDGATGFGSRWQGDTQGAHACESCPLAQFGSARRPDGQPARGQACKQVKILFFLPPESILPVVVSLPPTSIQPVKRFFLGLLGRMIRPHQVEVSLSLEKAQSKDGVGYARAVPKLVRRLSEIEIQRIASVAAGLAKVFRSARVQKDDLGAEEREVVDAG